MRWHIGIVVKVLTWSRGMIEFWESIDQLK